ncbi:MAG: alpha/beta hydrolase fold domain-containing protein [Chloroflexi bacterium]|nr:alpha/beta hydrolase fold domain-containing protein [Chloroflexota bacterium]
MITKLNCQTAVPTSKKPLPSLASLSANKYPLPLPEKVSHARFGLIMAFVTTTTLLNPAAGRCISCYGCPNCWPRRCLRWWWQRVGCRFWLASGGGDPLLVGLGITSTFLALRRLAAVTAPREAELVEAFGADWEANSRDAARSILRRRWRPVVWGGAVGRVQRNVVYGVNPETGAPLIADLLHPPEGVPASGLAMIFVHGGAWRYGRRNIDKFPYFHQLAGQGHLIMDIDYTLNPKTSVPGMVMDVKRAILWLKNMPPVRHQPGTDCVDGAVGWRSFVFAGVYAQLSGLAAQRCPFDRTHGG